MTHTSNARGATVNGSQSVRWVARRMSSNGPDEAARSADSIGARSCRLASRIGAADSESVSARSQRNPYGLHKHMKLQHIRMFVAVYQTRSFTAAAEQLNATQSGVSTQIKELEDELAATVFVRSARGVSPTRAGEVFYAYSLRMLQDLEAAKRQVRAVAGSAEEKVTIGVSPHFPPAILVFALERFSKEHPECRVSVIEASSEALVDGVADGEIDWAILAGWPEDRRVSTTRILHDRGMLVRRASDGRRPVEEGPLKLILPTERHLLRKSLREILSRAQGGVAEIREIDALGATLELVEYSDWATILPACFCSRLASRFNVSACVLGGHPASLDIVRVTSPSREPGENGARLSQILKEALASETTQKEDDAAIRPAPASGRQAAEREPLRPAPRFAVAGT